MDLELLNNYMKMIKDSYLDAPNRHWGNKAVPLQWEDKLTYRQNIDYLPIDQRKKVVCAIATVGYYYDHNLSLGYVTMAFETVIEKAAMLNLFRKSLFYNL